MSNYREQSAEARLALWQRIATESPAERAAAPHTIDADAQVAALAIDVASREVSLAATLPRRTELPEPSRPLPQRVERDYALSRAGYALARGLAERPVLVGRPDSLRAQRELARLQREVQRNAGRDRETQAQAQRAAKAAKAAARRYR